MTATEQFIRDAIEGGWNLEQFEGIRISRIDVNSAFIDDKFYVHFFDRESDMFSFSTAAMFLDPEAWRAVGKVRGWDEERTVMEKTLYEGGSLSVMATGHFARMVGLPVALAKGKTIEEYLASLLPLTDK